LFFSFSELLSCAGFITFDSHIHFYNLSAKLSSPHMIVVSDITDVILPLPEDLLVNLSDSRAVVEALLDSLPSMFKTGNPSGSCTGEASLFYVFILLCSCVVHVVLIFSPSLSVFVLLRTFCWYKF
jgi:hypothetical protein